MRQSSDNSIPMAVLSGGRIHVLNRNPGFFLGKQSTPRLTLVGFLEPNLGKKGRVGKAQGPPEYMGFTPRR